MNRLSIGCQFCMSVAVGLVHLTFSMVCPCSSCSEMRLWFRVPCPPLFLSAAVSMELGQDYGEHACPWMPLSRYFPLPCICLFWCLHDWKQFFCGMICWGFVTIVRCLYSQLLVRLMGTSLGSGMTTHQQQSAKVSWFARARVVWLRIFLWHHGATIG